jgi:hypothetical protein
MYNEWVFDSSCTHHMDNDASFLVSLDEVMERRIYVVDDISFNIDGRGDVSCRYGRIFYVYHVPNLSANLLLVSQLKKTCKIVEFWLYRFFVRDLKKGRSIVIGEFLDPKDNLYKFFDMTQPDYEPDTLFPHG